MSYVFGNIRVEDNFTGARSYVRVATTANIATLATGIDAGSTVDGETLVAGDRILVKNQSTATENGIYNVQDASDPVVRADDLATGDQANAVYTWVREGTANANTAWICTSPTSADTVGTHNLTFTQYDVVSDLVVARGGTGVADLTSGRVLVGAGTSAVDLTKAAPTGAFVGTTDSQDLTNKNLQDTTTVIYDATNGTDTGIRFDTSNITDTNIRVWDFPDQTDTVVGRTSTQTLTNKTLTTPTITGAELSIDDDGSAFNLNLTSLSSPALTADRTFTLDTDNADRTLAMGGNITTAGDFTTSGAFAITFTATAATNVTLPTTGTLANQAYVDSVVQGLDVKESVVATTDDALNNNASITGTITYTATGGTSGRGQITATLAVSDTFTVDGVTFAAADDGSRILLKNEASGASPNGARNGIWTTTISGTSLTLDRATDFDSDSEVTSGAFTFTEEGTVNISTGWVLTTPDPIIIGGASGTVLTFSLFSASGDVIAGAGLSKNANVLDVNTSTTIAIVSDNVVVNSTNTANQILLSAGTAGTEATFGALPLGDDNAVTGLLDLDHGGTNVDLSGATGARLIQTNAGTTALETTTTPSVTALISTTGGENFVTFTDPGTVVNYFNVTAAATGVAPTFRSVGEANTGMILADSNGAEALILGSVASALNEVTITNAATGVNPTIRSSGQANTGLILADSNSNEVLILESTASAVNEITVTNAATGNAPTLAVTGTNTNIDLDLQAKGTGVYNFLSTADVPAEIRLFEDTDLGTNYVGLDVPDVTTSYTLTMPAAVGTSQQVLRLADGSGNLEFATIAAATGLVGYSIWSGQISVTSASATSFAYFAWDESQYGTYDDPSTVVFWYEGVTSRDLTVTVYNATTASSIGSTTISTGGSATGIGTISITTNPSADARIDFQAHKDSGGGANPQIYGIQWEFTH